EFTRQVSGDAGGQRFNFVQELFGEGIARRRHDSLVVEQTQCGVREARFLVHPAKARLAFIGQSHIWSWLRGGRSVALLPTALSDGSASSLLDDHRADGGVRGVATNSMMPIRARASRHGSD